MGRTKINDGLTPTQRYRLRHPGRARAASLRWYYKNQSRSSETGKKWRKENPERALLLSLKWNREHKEKMQEINRAYYARNKERKAAEKRAYRAAHPERENETKRRWYKNNPDVARVAQMRKRLRRRKLEVGTVTSSAIAKLVMLQKGKCYWCHGPYGKFHVDHVWPLSKGGAHNDGNIVLSCVKCNLSKRDKLPSEFAGILL